MEHPPTPEQQEIIDFAKGSTSNLMISALAGAAKTSTLVMVAEVLSDVQMLCLAFNRAIAEEMRKRLPPNCTSSTLNALGHRTWGTACSSRLSFDASKVNLLLKQEVNRLEPKRREEAWDNFADIQKAINWGKACGWVPDKHFTNSKRLMDNKRFFDSLDEEPTDLMAELMVNVTVESLNQGVKGRIDYGDQILLPVLFPVMFDSYPHILIDESQDLSELNHAFLRKLVRKRITAVGDTCQGIYAFRGAHTESMAVLKDTFAMTELGLSISFRCPQLVVHEARWRAPHMRWPEWAKEGQVRTMKEWHSSDIPDDAAIICRNNAPLFSIACKLLLARRRPQIIGNDIGKGLIRTMKKFGSLDMSQDEVLFAIEDWLQEKLKRARSEDKFNDQAECMRVFARGAATLEEALAYAEDVLSQSGPIKLMTGHKSKGLEFDNVFILDRQLVRLEEDQQEQNLLYVMQTRSKNSLTYIESANYAA